ncbi:protein crumbs homolog 3a [Clupea harengus]|uniref:Protein crumbs homolog 3a n=1 Tax=Clupea harengus TaxID=7950 RepID=A0A8M1KLQ9_CLUHA|nr:protein crumbs homolog 3a [Clupea harengus]
MTRVPDTIPHFGLVAGGVLLLFLKNSPARAGNATITTGPLRNSNSTNSPDVVAIVVPTVVLGLLAVITAVLVYLFCVVRKKRQTEGTYRPSAEEQSGVRSVAMPDVLKLPKEERLI